ETWVFIELGHSGDDRDDDRQPDGHDDLNASGHMRDFAEEAAFERVDVHRSVTETRWTLPWCPLFSLRTGFWRIGRVSAARSTRRPRFAFEPFGGRRGDTRGPFDTLARGPCAERFTARSVPVRSLLTAVRLPGHTQTVGSRSHRGQPVGPVL